MEGTASYVPVIDYVSETVPSAEFRLVDVGCSGGIDPVWRGMGPRLRALAIDPNVSELERLRSAETHPGIEYLAASATLPPNHPFAAKAAGSSWWTRNPWDRLSVVKSLELMKSLGQSLPPELGAAALSSDTAISDESIIVPAFLRDHGIDSVDFLKIDVDGPDFDILNSFDEALGALNVLGLGIEVSYFGSASGTDRSFHNVDRFMKAQGFELFGMTQRRYSLSTLPSRYLWSVPAESEFGRPMFGDALYIKDLGNPEYARFSESLSTAKFLNLICIFAAFNLPDCAADVALRFRDRLTTLCSVDRILDLLAAQAQGPVEKPLSYSEYLRRFNSNSRMFFDAKAEHANQSRRDQPESESATGRPSQEFALLDIAALSRLRALGWTPRVVFDVGARKQTSGFALHGPKQAHAVSGRGHHPGDGDLRHAVSVDGHRGNEGHAGQRPVIAELADELCL